MACLGSPRRLESRTKNFDSLFYNAVLWSSFPLLFIKIHKQPWHFTYKYKTWQKKVINYVLVSSFFLTCAVLSTQRCKHLDYWHLGWDHSYSIFKTIILLAFLDLAKEGQLDLVIQGKSGSEAMFTWLHSLCSTHKVLWRSWTQNALVGQLYTLPATSMIAKKGSYCGQTGKSTSLYLVKKTHFEHVLNLQRFKFYAAR